MHTLEYYSAFKEGNSVIRDKDEPGRHSKSKQSQDKQINTLRYFTYMFYLEQLDFQKQQNGDCQGLWACRNEELLLNGYQVCYIRGTCSGDLMYNTVPLVNAVCAFKNCEEGRSHVKPSYNFLRVLCGL